MREVLAAFLKQGGRRAHQPAGPLDVLIRFEGNKLGRWNHVISLALAARNMTRDGNLFSSVQSTIAVRSLAQDKQDSERMLARPR